jgi:hypothetical protein
MHADTTMPRSERGHELLDDGFRGVRVYDTQPCRRTKMAALAARHSAPFVAIIEAQESGRR